MYIYNIFINKNEIFLKNKQKYSMTAIFVKPNPILFLFFQNQSPFLRYS